MDYFAIFNLTREPFANSPDPDFFYQTKVHVECLHHLEIGIRLRRGLNVIVGEVGMGKSTLSRQLARILAGDEKIVTKLILDPSFDSQSAFLRALRNMLLGYHAEADASEGELKEDVRQFLLKQAATEQKIIVLIIDEAQKLTVSSLEILREILNFETNESKLLQIVLFAQTEFEKTLQDYKNFADRINYYHKLEPLDFGDTKGLIKYRLEKASEGKRASEIFTMPAYYALYQSTGGHPRKIINLCHQILLSLIIQNKAKAGWQLVRACAERTFTASRDFTRKLTLRIVFALGIALLAAAGFLAFKQELPFSAQNRDVSMNASARQTAPSIPPADTPKPAEQTLETKKGDKPGGVKEPDKTSGPKSQDNATAQPTPAPRTLGELRIMENHIYPSYVLRKFYGENSPANTKALYRLNPRLDDAKPLRPQDIITLPAEASDAYKADNPPVLIRIAERDNPFDAFMVVRQMRQRLPNLTIFPYADSRRNMKFPIVLDMSFADGQTAKSAIASLPRDLAKTASVLDKWDKNSVFFSNFAFRKIEKR